MAGCFSCSEKKDTKSENKLSESDISVTESDGSVDEPVVQQVEFREFKEEDFKTINVNLTMTDKEPPFQLHSLKLSDIDFGERISPCKQGEYRDKYKPVFNDELNADDEYREYMEQANADWEIFCTEPTKGVISFWRMCGNDIYAAVSYDQCCAGRRHEASIFRVDGFTGKATEIYRHSDPESSFDIETIAVPNGKVYLSVSDKGLMYLDGDKLVPLHYLDGYSHYLMGDAADKMVFLNTKEDLKEVPVDYEAKEGELFRQYSENEAYLIKGEERVLSEYLPEKDEWRELTRASYTPEEIDSGENLDNDFPQIYGKLTAHTEKPEGKRKLDVVTDEYRISTGITGLNIIYADHDRLVVQLSSKNIIHIFDMAKMEHYVVDCSSLAPHCQYFEGGLFVYTNGGNGYIYYIMPEMGLTFTLYKLPEKSDENVSLSFGAFRGDRSFGFQEFIAVMKNEERDPDTGQIKYAEYDDEEIIYWVNGDEMNG